MYAIIAFIPILTFQFDECRFSAPREATVDAAGASRLYVSAGAGHLRVEGRPGLRQARIRATACASDRSLLEEIVLTARRLGEDIQVYANDRDLELRNREYARLNVIIEVPENIAATINDGSGELDLSGLGELDVKDGSGDITIHDIGGSLSVEDGSGQIRINDVRGDVKIEDGSGGLDLAGTEGTVDIRDGSGQIKVARVGRHALISDSSGDIDIDGVGGDLTVRSDTNGDIDWQGVRGTVQMPANTRDYSRFRFKLFR